MERQTLEKELQCSGNTVQTLQSHSKLKGWSEVSQSLHLSVFACCQLYSGVGLTCTNRSLERDFEPNTYLKILALSIQLY